MNIVKETFVPPKEETNPGCTNPIGPVCKFPGPMSPDITQKMCTMC